MILCYHRINPWYKNDALTVKPEEFKKQINYLISKKFEFVHLEQYISFPNSVQKRKIVITFDDGFEDNFLFAYEILKNLSIPFIIFLTVNFIGTENLLPRYKNKKKDRFLTWNEIIEMSKNGVEIGSHSLTHPALTELKKEDMEKEIINSKKIIEDRISKEVKFFSYPYGVYNKEVIEVVKKAGYEGALVNRKKIMKITQYTIPRVGIYGHNNFFIFKIKIWREFIREKF
jgi:peptidoglycan/xylan/chitin deacetylase (PgdA/CDA1 family)